MKDIVTEIKKKNASDGLFSRLHTAQERISELEAVSVELSKTEE